MFEFIILFSKTMKELKKRARRSYGNLRVFLISFFLLVSKESEDSPRNVEFGGTMYSDIL